MALLTKLSINPSIKDFELSFFSIFLITKAINLSINPFLSFIIIFSISSLLISDKLITALALFKNIDKFSVSFGMLTSIF